MPGQWLRFRDDPDHVLTQIERVIRGALDDPASNPCRW